MKFENADLGCSFSVPDRPTVRQQLQYYSQVRDTRGKEQYERMWAGAQALIADWQCPDLPDPNASLDEMTNPSQALIIIWAGGMVYRHFNALEDVPKN
jgi:hypothetical protein